MRFMVITLKQRLTLLNNVLERTIFTLNSKP